jgi:N-acetylglucosaminyldiphosphoundecaprenol N-acetyl-beta-D-mannosaminyltransferase
MPGQETVDLFGIPVARLGLAAVLQSVRQAIRSPRGRPWTLAYVNAYSCNLFLEDPEYRRALPQADVIYVDGNGPRLAGWLAGERLPRRMTGADWIHDLCALSRREGFRLYFLGSGQGVAAEASLRLRGQYPGLQIVGTRDGYFRPEEEAGLLEEIRTARPDVLILGMSSPLQEVWMARVAAGLAIPVIWAAGGVLEYASGRVRRAPRWMRRLGLEWLGRWMIEPRRLTRRYLAGIPLFLWRSVRHAVAHRRARRAGE